jgi:hypothetical protein
MIINLRLITQLQAATGDEPPGSMLIIRRTTKCSKQDDDLDSLRELSVFQPLVVDD